MSTASASQGSPEPPRFHSVSAAARILGVSPMTLYRLIAEGDFPAIRIRSRLVIPAKAIQDMADAAVSGQSVVDTADWPDRQATES
jgi:excisionase family DNA binding protein